jgi:phospholipid/cholesterol/gamma-HCH transport system ATP-binding protein
MELWPAELSGGMQKRVGLARAIAAHPSILFFDEPTTGLDPIMCGVIDNLINKSVRSLGATAITITHDLISMHAVADKVAMIYEGKIVWHGPVKNIESCTNPAVQNFLNGRNPNYTPKTI